MIFKFLLGNDELPAYIPFYYRLYLSFNKMRKSIGRRKGVTSSVNRYNLPEQSVKIDSGLSLELVNSQELNAINKTAMHYKEDLALSSASSVISELDKLRALLSEKGFRYSNFGGNFKKECFRPDSEQRKVWEMVWLILNSGIALRGTPSGRQSGCCGVSSPSKVLDVGGASTLFSFYLAKKGHSMRIIDNDWGDSGLIYNANYVAKKVNFDLKALKRDASEPFPFADSAFDFAFCVCVLEHLPRQSRRFAMGEIARVLKRNGIVGLTFDYAKGRGDGTVDNGLRFSDLERIEQDIIRPSGLVPYGNKRLYDNYPENEFHGALFLKKI